MKEYTSDSIRNVVLVGHGSSGKTMMAEAFLHFTGATTRLGKIEDGTCASDYDDEEIRKKISLYTSILPVEFRNTKINILDAPGFPDFIGEVISALRVSDAALVLVDAVSGLEVGTEIAWRYCSQFKLPRFLVINKMDRDNANFQKALNSVSEKINARFVKLHLPWGEKQDFKGVIDLVKMKVFSGDGKNELEIPAEFHEVANAARAELMEAAAEGEDSLLEKYLETGGLSDDELLRGLMKVVQSGTFVPILCSAAGHEIGVGSLLEAIVSLLPSPTQANIQEAKFKDDVVNLTAIDNGPLAAYIWKTTADPFVGRMTYFRVYSGNILADSRVWNQVKETEERMSGLHFQRGKEQIPVKTIHAGDIGSVSKLSVSSSGETFSEKNHPLTMSVPDYPSALFQVAIGPKTQADATKISSSLTRLCEEDMTLSWHNEKATGQTILQGMGDQHIDVAIRRAETKFQVGLLTFEPKVPYREGITKKANAQYRHKKQSGGSGQFGEVHLRIEPYAEGDFEFTDELVGMNLSKSYLPAIEKGISATLITGVIAGYPMNNVKVIVYDGKEHPVDSKPVAFEIAGREAFKLAVQDAGPVLFEPIMNVRVVIPDEYMGDVMSDLNSRRGRVQGTDSEHGSTVVVAHVPMAEMLRYTTQLRSITGGRGYFNMEIDHYEVIPSHIAAGIIEAHKKELAEKKEE